ncbi:dynein regulatory complex subunit 6 isoform X2 [Sceloporus undulatus]|uniref:dynein regulatory complex subunit 6 isoform X2 n=1 Tax=Sceloporus undulatus TaxID=8520 RepID=UPI001C4BE1DD|nr:dynein regulatory complex subunit 6 isoform X2 [Sceloporus undulatus]
MATFHSVSPELRAYFKKHSIPDIYEALLCGLLIMCPDDPLRFLEEKIKEIMEKGLYSILWNMCIDPYLSQRLKVISETYLHTLLGLDDDQLMTTELCDKAWDFYSTNLKRMCFDAWIKYCAMRRIGKQILQRKLSFARHVYESKLLKSVLEKWNAWVQLRKVEHERAAKRIGKVFAFSLQKIIFKAWRKETSSRRKTKLYMERVERDFEDDIDEEPERRYVSERERRQFDKHSSSRYISYDHVPHIRTGKDHLTKMPGRVLAQIFRYLTVIDLARCAQVNRTWKALTQTGSVWSNINFSAVKDIVKDNIAGNILLKWTTNVVHLNLRGCSTLQWLTFKSIGRCINLQELNVSECQGLNDELMRLVSEGCPALLYLNLSHTDITNGTLRLLPRGFPNLQYLSLAYCRKFTDKGLQYLGSGRGCHKLSYLDISGCLQITVEGFRNIGNSCSGIQYLTINEMPTLTDRCVQALTEKCKQIVSVEFNESPHVSDTGFKALAECKLVKMRIEGSNRVTDQGFRVVSKFWSTMKHICVADCQKITDVALKLIAPLDRIIVLNLSHCIRISDAGIKSFVDGSSGSRIRELILSNCSYVTDSAVLKIAQRCPNLIYLNLSHCRAVTDAGIETLVLISSLAYINISGLDITDQRFCFDVRRLDYIDFSFCPQLSNHSLKNLTLNCRKLTTLSMVGCCKINDVGIQFVAVCCNFLHYLDISGCVNITDKALKFLGKGCHQLRILKMLYCKGITRQAVLKYAPKLQKCEYSDDDPPLWFSYYSTSDTTTLKKQKKRRQSASSPQQSVEPSSEGKALESAGSSKLEPPGEKISEITELLAPPTEKNDEYVTPPTVDTPGEN